MAENSVMAPASPEKYSPLAPDRAFVVQLRQEVKVSPETLSGRVEHISSGRVALFASLSQLYAFIGEFKPEEEPARLR